MKSFITFLLLFTISVSQSVTITVTGSDGTVADDGVCSISEAIISANNDTTSGAMPGECPAGNGADIIQLTGDILFLQQNHDDNVFGRTATPAVTSNITLEGMGFSLERDSMLTCNTDNTSDPEEFRLLRVADGGSLHLLNTHLINGCVYGGAYGPRFYGGAVFNDGSLNISSCVFTGNSSNLGGGIYNYDMAVISKVSHTVFDSSSIFDSGGGIANQGGVIGEINNNLFSNNQVYIGGGIANIDGHISLITNNTFFNNDAGIGGAISNTSFSTPSEIGVLRNNTFSENTAEFSGGAVSNFDTINNVSQNTFANNSAGSQAGAYRNLGTTNNMNNNLFINNSAVSSDNDCSITSGTVSGSNNISNQNNGTCGGVIDLTTLTTLSIDTLADNGCYQSLADGTCVQTHALLAGSEAINASIGNISNHDARDFSANGIRDIGAFEYEGINDLVFKTGF